MTPSEFAAFVSAQAEAMASAWTPRSRPDGGYPARLPVEDWWKHFSELVMPEAMLALNSQASRAPAETRRRAPQPQVREDA